MSPEERAEFLPQARTCRVATISPSGPHVSPLWFLWHDESIWLYSIAASQRFTELQRDPRIAIGRRRAWKAKRAVRVGQKFRVVQQPRGP